MIEKTNETLLLDCVAYMVIDIDIREGAVVGILESLPRILQVLELQYGISFNAVEEYVVNYWSKTAPNLKTRSLSSIYDEYITPFVSKQQ